MAQQYYSNVQDLFGNALPSSVVTVKNYPSGTIASIYSDNALTKTMSNPFTLSSVTGNTGIVAFYASNGQYQVSSNTGGVVTTYPNVVVLYDPALDPGNSFEDLQSSAALRNSSPPSVVFAVFISSFDGGWFRRDPTDTSSAEDGGAYCGTIIRSADYATNGVWKRVFSGGISPYWYGAKCDNSTLDDTALANWVAQGGTYQLIWPEGKTSPISTSLTLLSNTSILGASLGGIRQTTANTAIFTATSVSNIDIGFMTFTGLGSDFVDSSPRNALALVATGCTSIHVHNCTFNNFSYSAVRFYQSNDCNFVKNNVTGIGGLTSSNLNCYGCLWDGNTVTLSLKGLAEGNIITSVCQGLITNEAQGIRIVGNLIYSTYQHGMYLGAGLQDCTVVGNVLESTGLVGIKVQAQDYATIDNQNIAISGNTIRSAGDSAILVQNGATGSTYRNRTVAITGNTILNPAGAGIYVSDCIGISIKGNVITSPGQAGIFHQESQNVDIDENEINSSALSAIRDGLSCQYVSICRNRINNCATAATAGDLYGIFIQGSSGLYNPPGEYVIDGNIITDANAHMKYGIRIAVGQTAFILRNNVVKDATDYGLDIDTPTAMRIYQNNYWGGTLGPVTAEPSITAVASAATITLPQVASVVSVTGAIDITSITAAGFSGKTVTLVFTGILTLTNGSNLKLTGNYVTSAGAAIQLSCDGTNWYENRG